MTECSARLFRLLLVLFCVCWFPLAGMGMTGCGGDSDDDDAAGQTDDGTNESADDAGDRSIRTAEWEQSGGPNPARTWTPRDYEAAAGRIGEIARSEPWRLPRHGSSRSGAVFARLINPANLGPLADGPLPARIAAATAVREMANRIATHYHEVTIRLSQLIQVGEPLRPEEAELLEDRRLDREVVELDGFLLDVVIRRMKLRLQQLEAADADPRVLTGERRQAADYIIGLVQRFAATDWFRDDAIQRFGAILAEHVPDAFQQFDAPTRDELRAVIEDTLTRVRSSAAKSALQDVLRSLPR